MYLLYHEYSPYRRELIAHAKDESEARDLAREYSRQGKLVVSVRQEGADVRDSRQLCAFLRGQPHLAA